MAIHDATPIQRRVMSVLVENRSGVLSHVVGLFSARGFNIDSLAVGETEDPTMSRITLVSSGDARTIEQIKKQLNKLIDVIKVQDLTEEGFVDRELILVKMKNSPKTQVLLKDLKTRYHLHLITEDAAFVILESTETPENSAKLFEAFKEAGIIEIAKTGTVALSIKSPKD